jgi:hypothetical protein
MSKILGHIFTPLSKLIITTGERLNVLTLSVNMTPAKTTMKKYMCSFIITN